MSSPPPDQQLGDKAEKVLNAAADLFSNFGFDAVALSAIAEQADVSKANIFHHFKSKEALYHEVLRMAARSSNKLFEKLDASQGKLKKAGNYKELVSNFALCHLRNHLENPRNSRLLIRELLNDCSENGIKLTRDDFSQTFTRLVDLINEGREKGDIREDADAALIALLIFGGNMFFSQLLNLLKHIPETDFANNPEKYSRQMMSIIMEGIGAAKQETE